MNPSTSLRCSLTLGTLVLLSACGGGGSSAPPVDPPPPPPPPPQVGQLLDVQPLGDISRRDIADAIADSNRIPTSLAPRYGVTTYRLSYTTQTCSCCGSIPASSPKGRAGLRIREWVCSDCGAQHDRDVNAAKNILARGLARLAEGTPAEDGDCAHAPRIPVIHDGE